MPVAACLSFHQCLARRDEIFRRDAIWTRDHECTSCVIGTARRMDSFTPEPDLEPQPQRDAGKVRVKRTDAKCADCGKKITPYAKLCKPCRGKRRTAAIPVKCTVEGCRWKARRGGLCHSHYWRTRPAPYTRAKEATA